MNSKKIIALVCPVYNEEETLEKSVKKLVKYCEENLTQYEWYVCVVDNASTDNTQNIAEKLQKEHSIKFKYIRLKDKGKGLAVRSAWMNNDFDYSIYMDIDLSTDLDAIIPTLDMLEKGVDLVVGSRKAKEAKVIDRPLKREITSAIYIAIAKIMSSVPYITDFQCGFKGIKKDVALKILPSIVDNTWYFDSELIINASKLGYKIQEIPVKWTDDPTSTVKVKKVTQVLLFGLYRNLSEKSWLTGGVAKSKNVFSTNSFFDHFIESIKFLFVGTLCFFIDLIIAVIFQHFSPDILTSIKFVNQTIIIKDIYVAVSLGFIMSVPINFYLNRVFTFQSTSDSIYIQAFKFLPVLFTGILIKLISAYIWTDLLGLYKILAIPFSSIVMLISNYLGHKFFTFKSGLDKVT